jgi:hypothetical protein
VCEDQFTASQSLLNTAKADVVSGSKPKLVEGAMLAEEAVSGSKFDASRVILRALDSHFSSSFVRRPC